jgi:hypothetical protein
MMTALLSHLQARGRRHPEPQAKDLCILPEAEQTLNRSKNRKGTASAVPLEKSKEPGFSP